MTRDTLRRPGRRIRLPTGSNPPPTRKQANRARNTTQRNKALRAGKDNSMSLNMYTLPEAKQSNDGSVRLIGTVANSIFKGKEAAQPGIPMYVDAGADSIYTLDNGNFVNMHVYHDTEDAEYGVMYSLYSNGRKVKSAVQVPLTGKGFSDITDTLNTLF